jgi:hypothetical protein
MRKHKWLHIAPPIIEPPPRPLTRDRRNPFGLAVALMVVAAAFAGIGAVAAWARVQPVVSQIVAALT